jgi:tRNA nucleotidyltransferase (CCA-adding enzyme)
MSDSYAELPRERVWGEWHKFATKATKPSRGLAVLKESGWLKHFPELATLDGLPQEPEWHPEGDVLTHVGHCMDALVSLPGFVDASTKTRETLSFAVLCHDLGKATTTERAEKHGVPRWTSPGHDREGGPLVESFLENLGSPLELREHVRNLVLSHHAHQSWPFEGPTDATVRRLSRKLEPATIEELTIVMEADHRGRPPLLSEKTLIRIDRLRESARRLAVETKPPAPLLLGRDLIALGRKPGPDFAPVLQAAFDAQLDGVFSNHDEGMAWLRAHLDSGTPTVGDAQA